MGYQWVNEYAATQTASNSQTRHCLCCLTVKGIRRARLRKQGGYLLGDPLDPVTTLGPMAHVRFAQTVREQTAEAIAAGASSLIDASAFADDGGAYRAPQILVDVNHGMRVMREESFGPVVGIMPVDSDEHAI